MMSSDQGGGWEATWAVLSLVIAEATAFLTVYPTLQGVPGFTREGLTAGFGLLLSAIYFLAGLPCVFQLRRFWNWVKRKWDAIRKALAKES